MPAKEPPTFELLRYLRRVLIGDRLPIVDFIELEQHARMAAIVLEIALCHARSLAIVEHVDIEPTGFAQMEQRTEFVDRLAFAIDRLLVLHVRFGVVGEELIELLLVRTPAVSVSPRVAVRRAVLDQRLLHADLRTEAETCETPASLQPKKTSACSSYLDSVVRCRAPWHSNLHDRAEFVCRRSP